MAKTRGKPKGSSSYKRRLRDNYGPQRKRPDPYAYAFYAAALLAIILLAAFLISFSDYNSLIQAINSSNIINPPIRFFSGTSPVNITGVTRVSANQTFCPENATVSMEAAMAFSYNYYTVLKPGSEFSYAFATNTSDYYKYAVIAKPFSIVSYSYVTYNESVCQGYPLARYAFKLTIRAPDNYTGPIYMNLYR